MLPSNRLPSAESGNWTRGRVSDSADVPRSRESGPTGQRSPRNACVTTSAVVCARPCARACSPSATDRFLIRSTLPRKARRSDGKSDAAWGGPAPFEAVRQRSLRTQNDGTSEPGGFEAQHAIRCQHNDSASGAADHSYTVPNRMHRREVDEDRCKIRAGRTVTTSRLHNLTNTTAQASFVHAAASLPSGSGRVYPWHTPISPCSRCREHALRKAQACYPVSRKFRL
jgi:hypothetical protein